MSAPLSPLVRRRLCPWCRVEVLTVDVEWGRVVVDVGEADLVGGEAVFLGERDLARWRRPHRKRLKGEALHRVHVCALAEVAA